MTQTPDELTGTPPVSGGDDVLADVLARLRLDSAIFLRAEYANPWAYESPSCSDLCAVLRPGAERLVLFHIVARGRCWIEVAGETRLEASEGDVLVLPYSDVHRMGGSEPADVVPIGTLLPPLPWRELPVIRHGGTGERTDVICGYLDCDDLLFDPLLRALPRLFRVMPPPGPASAWVAASIEYAMHASQARSHAMSSRLPELLLVEVLRLHTRERPESDVGWLSALRDPVTGPALRELHREPARKWTVTDLARRVGTSRSVLDERFRTLLGRPPMRYLTHWRLQCGAQLLRTSKSGVAEVAYQVGYESEAAFTRAFKRHVGVSPARWRQQTRKVGASGVL
jgi:AraC-like DNA-binding protein